MEKEENIIKALTEYIAGNYSYFNAKAFANFFPDGTASKDKIEREWRQFLSLLEIPNETNLSIKETVLNELGLYYENDTISLSEEKQYNVAILEGCLKCILYHIDPIVYTPQNIEKKCSTINDCCKELLSRASYNLNESYLSGISYILDIAREWRNSRSHMNLNKLQKPYHEVIEHSIRGFFASTVLYDNIKDTAAGLNIETFMTPFSISDIMVECCKQRKKIKFNKKENKRETLKIAIPFSAFGEEKKATIDIKFSAPDYTSVTKTVEVTRGKFPSKTVKGTLIKQGTEIDKKKKTPKPSTVPVPPTITPQEEEEKKQKIEDQKKRQEETERRQREEDEKKRQEETERRQREEEEKKRQEETERRQREADEKRKLELEKIRQQQAIEEKRIQLEMENLRQKDAAIKLQEDKKSFAEYQQRLKDRIQAMTGDSETCLRLKELARKDIDNQPYDRSKTFEKNKEAIDMVVKKLESDLARQTSAWGVSKEWIKRNWKWCSIVLCAFIVAMTVIGLWNTKEREPIPQETAVTLIESKSWVVTMMEGKSVSESASISALSSDKSSYGIRIITANGELLEPSFTVNWETGKVSSKELGEGRIEKNNNTHEIMIEFELWKFALTY